MKKTLLFAFLILATISAEAQVTFKPGIRAGANFSQITNTDLDTKTDFYIGAFGALKLTRFYTLQPEINYSRQGGKGDISVYDSNTQEYNRKNVDVSLNYVSLSAMNKFTFSDQFNIHVGPTFDIITKSKNYNSTEVDMCIAAGVGYTLPMGLTIEARVKKGIIDVVDSYYTGNSYDNFNDYGTTTNLVFSLGVSYSFDVKGATK
ncbi:outer membrane beta-barrel protein [Flavobacterium cerinum]|uniref:PorT family protein n=1 Tax=Flavobacterium cerinum TaxID=2502784 RepID=A0A3S3RFH5_9FLAO|nr:outer membrane beta-barrel protein [Flavobacterium cerinum]RWW93754.1 PorT family protein [Flavobacterium cerinum]